MGLDYLNLQANSQIRSAAKSSLKGQWWLPIGYCIIVALIAGMSQSLSILSVLVMGPLTLGEAFFFLAWVRKENPDIDTGFKGFKFFGNSLGLYLLQAIFIALWSLLLIIPGIIKAFAYSQSFYIMADYPELGPMESLTLSQDMMKGAKAKLFSLHLHFILLGILCVFTLFIGFIWLIPFINTAKAEFYQDLKLNYQRDNVQ